MRRVPEPKYDRDISRLISYYKRAFVAVLEQLQMIPGGIDREQSESLLRQLTVILTELDENTRQWAEETIRRAFEDGQAAVLVSVGMASSLAEAAGMVSVSMLARDTVEALINDTYGDLLQATRNTERKVKQLVRTTVSDTMRMKALQQMGRNTARNDIVEQLSRQGLSKRLSDEAWKGIIDRAGRRWNLSTYAEMVVRTKLTQAHFEGTRTEAMERGVDLAIISSHGAKDACRYFEGMIISMNGLTPGYKTYAELKASNKIFHPNCQHKVTAVGDLDLLPQAVREKHAAAMKSAKQALS